MKDADTFKRKQSTLKWAQFHLIVRITPVFYATQVDLCGPLKAYSPHKKGQQSKFG